MMNLRALGSLGAIGLSVLLVPACTSDSGGGSEATGDGGSSGTTGGARATLTLNGAWTYSGEFTGRLVCFWTGDGHFEFEGQAPYLVDIGIEGMRDGTFDIPDYTKDDRADHRPARQPEDPRVASAEGRRLERGELPGDDRHDHDLGLRRLGNSEVDGQLDGQQHGQRRAALGKLRAIALTRSATSASGRPKRCFAEAGPLRVSLLDLDLRSRCTLTA
jgi:hypothetical protein